ncbi:MAG: hypothetical protein AAFQ82_16270 [Myxococcota bacterium]
MSDQESCHVRLGNSDRDAIAEFIGRRLPEGSWSLSPEDQGWVSIGLRDESPRPLLEALSSKLSLTVVSEWYSGSVDQGGSSILSPQYGKWMSVEEVSPDGDPLPDDYRFAEYRFMPGDIYKPPARADSANDGQFYQIARAGDAKRLLELASQDANQAYFWLKVAGDLGHDVSSEVEYLESQTHLAYDSELGINTSLELARHYFIGDTLEASLRAGGFHLSRYFELGGEDRIAIERLRDEAPPSARTLIEEWLGSRLFWKTRRDLRRLEELFRVSAPKVIMVRELGRLEESLGELRSSLLEGPHRD